MLKLEETLQAIEGLASRRFMSDDVYGETRYQVWEALSRGVSERWTARALAYRCYRRAAWQVKYELSRTFTQTPERIGKHRLEDLDEMPDARAIAAHELEMRTAYAGLMLELTPEETAVVQAYQDGFHDPCDLMKRLRVSAKRLKELRQSIYLKWLKL